MASQAEFTIGVEEEYQIIDPETRQLVGRGKQIIPTAQETLGQDVVQPEMHLSQVEIATPVCQTLADVRNSVISSRRSVIEAAAKEGKAIAAAGTHPFSHWKQQQFTPKDRYLALKQDLQQIIREAVIFGCHIHIGLSDRNLAIQVVNRARVWLAPLLALSANSPFWLGEDTGYASYRTELWWRLPLTGPPLLFKDYAEYEELIQALVTTNAVDDPTKIYWDIRLSERFPTIEFRVADVCLTVDEAVMIAGVVRALVQTCYQQAIAQQEFAHVRPELIRASHWRAARYGLESDLIDVVQKRSIPAKELIEALLTQVRPALEEAGDWEEVSGLVEQTLQCGNAATRQRKAYQRRESFPDVVDLIIAETAAGVDL